MLASDLVPQLRAYIAAPARLAALDLAPGTNWQLAFLAQGEYNINYLLTTEDDRRRVIRVNVGTQIGKPGGEQIAYEAAALALLGPHGVAPHLYYVDDTLATLPYGVLAMEYVPASTLRYGDARQIAAAAQTLARLHRVPADGPFIRRRALVDDLAEAQGWLAPYLSCERVSEPQRKLFETLLARAEASAARHTNRFPEPFALVHTDVQAHNFIISATESTKDHEERERAHQVFSMGSVSSVASEVLCRLVDWERPLIDDPTYDLAHFLIPTTTQWKCGYTFSADEREHFLSEYCAAR